MKPLTWLHSKLERHLSHKVGRYMIACQNARNWRKETPKFPTNFWFKAASRIEFRLRNYLYPRRPVYMPMFLPRYPTEM